MIVRKLPDSIVNRIAAGEVVERPASVVKELVENSLDAGATEIELIVRDGGRGLIAVSDNGAGMAADDLVLAVERHATSKLADDALSRIASFGFRGEALPSIGAVSRLTVTTRREGCETGWSLGVHAGRKGEAEPVAHAVGTRVEVRDLFFATPARLKFLKAAATETRHAVEAVYRLAMANPHIGFALSDGARSMVKLPRVKADAAAGRIERLGAIMGKDFAANAVAVEGERDGARLTGFAGLPTLNRRLAASQYLFVNGRPVRDRLLFGAIRVAYQGLLPSDRNAVAALFLDIDCEDVDVNVHPMKSEVRFRDANAIRGLLIASLRHALGGADHRAAVSLSGVAASFAPGFAAHSGGHASSAAYPRHAGTPGRFSGLRDPGPAHGFDLPGLAERPEARPVAAADQASDIARAYPLGAARAQLHATYIVAETADGLVIVDQHAAHERLTQERLKRALAQGGPARQGLLIPEVVELDEARCAAVVARADELAALGLAIEAFGHNAVIVRETPALLGAIEAGPLVRDLAEDLIGYDAALSLSERIDDIIATLACHHSVRAGRLLSSTEMNAMLREMETTAHAGQCSHGRPTYVELKLADIERLFGRR